MQKKLLKLEIKEVSFIIQKLKEMVTILYTEGNGFPRIAIILSKIFNRKFCYQLIIKWIKKMHKIYNECKILEMNELCTYVKKT